MRKTACVSTDTVWNYIVCVGHLQVPTIHHPLAMKKVPCVWSRMILQSDLPQILSWCDKSWPNSWCTFSLNNLFMILNCSYWLKAYCPYHTCAALFVNLPWVALCMYSEDTHTHTHRVTIFQLCFSGFSKGWMRLLSADCVQRWKPAELSHGDTGTKAW